MNCVECRDNLVALSEGVLGAGERDECQAHLRGCAGCQAEYAAIVSLRQRLMARGRAAAGAGLVAAVMRRVQEQQQQPERETIMSKLIRHRWGFSLSAAAGMAMVAVAAFMAFSPRAFGIDQVIAAYNHVRSLHVKEYTPGEPVPNEYWIQCDHQGKPEKARYDLQTKDDGEKLITWTAERTEIWFKNKHGFRIMQTQRIAPMMQGLLDGSQPQLVMKKLEEARQAGKVDVQTIEPQGQQTNTLIVAVHHDGSSKEIYCVDRKTDLITRVEHYRLQGTNAVLKSWTEFSDYNAPIDEKMFHLQDQLPADVSVADQLTQVTGVPQAGRTDAEAAAETVRQFFQAVMDKDYKQAGLIYGGEQEASFKQEFGNFTIAKMVSVGPAELQTNWVKRGYRVPCKLELVEADGHKFVAEPGPYVRPGDDEEHPDNWNITGGVNLGEGGANAVKVLPDNAQYAALTPEATARAFFEACSSNNWDEAGKFMPYLNERVKEYLGGLKIVSIGDSFSPDKYPGGLAAQGYPGRFVPYEIQLVPQEFNVRLSNTNAAKRYVLTGFYDQKLKLEQDFKWSGEPDVLTNNETYAALTPKEAVQAYFAAQAKLDWTEMRKFTSAYDVEESQRQVNEGQKAGVDVQKAMPVFEVGEATWSAADSAWYVKCRAFATKKWNLAVRKDNPAGRWQVDGGI
jgi:hypothetical protein